jgi:hypothetical protein
MWQHIMAKLRKHLFVCPIVSDLVVDQSQQLLNLITFIGPFFLG